MLEGLVDKYPSCSQPRAQAWYPSVDKRCSAGAVDKVAFHPQVRDR